MIDVEPGTIAVYSDISCPWAHVAVYRLHAMRRKLGLEGRVALDMRAFPLEVFNEQPTPKKVLDAEISVAGGLAPEAGWQMWQRPEAEYPVTTLPALEAVEAAKEQGLAASEQLDRALRVALFARSGVISMRHEILETADGCDLVDPGRLADILDSGAAKSALFTHKEEAESEEVRGSPHLFLPDGSDFHNPGVKFEWQGEHGVGFPIVTSDTPDVYEGILARFLE